jgi:hypothetical protein
MYPRTARRRSATARTVTTLAASLAILATYGTGMSAHASPVPGRLVPAATATHRKVHGFTVPRNVKLVQTRTSLLGVHKWYRQVAHGHFVVGGWYGTHYNKFSKHLTVWDGRKHVGAVAVSHPEIGVIRAASVAAQHAKTSAGHVVKTGLWILPPTRRSATARLVYAVSTADGRGARTTYVDAANARVLKTVREAEKARGGRKPLVTGTALVFDPNPVVKLQDENLKDDHNAANAVPPAGYTRVSLFGLDASHSLTGRYVHIVNRKLAHSATNTYLFNRSNPFFEQTNAYYAVNKEQAFLHRLGFVDVNSSPQKVLTDAFPDDNSYFDPQDDQISLGRGGVDDAEDPEVVWHEYGHAMQADQVIDFGQNNQGAAMGEGFGDYMAVTMSQGTEPVGTALTPTACVMDWDSTFYTPGPTHCLRRTDLDKIYPRDLNADPHLGGEIWSRALWDMNKSMGRNDATRVIVESQFWMYPTIKMLPGAQIMVNVTKMLMKNGLIAPGSLTKVRAALTGRHLLPVAVRK